jgi:heat-inducible transcriptional repressor
MSRDTATVRNLFEAFSRKGSVLHLLDRCLDSDGIQLFIGEESGYGVFEDLSLVSARYEVNGRVAGVLGVVGPTHMAYHDIIPVVDVTARVLGAALKY